LCSSLANEQLTKKVVILSQEAGQKPGFAVEGPAVAFAFAFRIRHNEPGCPIHARPYRAWVGYHERPHHQSFVILRSRSDEGSAVALGTPNPHNFRLADNTPMCGKCCIERAGKMPVKMKPEILTIVITPFLALL